MIGGFYVLAEMLTRDRGAAGIAALAGFLNVDFLVRMVGGHNTALMPIALAPWILIGTFRVVNSGDRAWVGLTVLATAAASAYDVRWVLPVFAIAAILALTMASSSGGYNPKLRFLAISACAIGLVLPNLPWLFASMAGNGFSPAPPASYESPIWVQRLSFATLWDALAVWNPSFGTSFNEGPVVLSHLPTWGGFFSLAVFLAVVTSRRRLAFVFFALYVVGALLYTGSHPPLGGMYVWAFQHIPFFSLYREPLKFGAATSLCASIVLAYGIAALRPGSFARTAGVVTVCALIVALATPVIHKSGLLVTRSPDPAYDLLQRAISRDQHFSRVLWLPQRSRWVSGSALHPVANGPWLGIYDWNIFRWQRGFDDDVIDYVRTPLFIQLLRWGAFRYVVLDCTTEVDATVRTDSFSCSKIAIELARRDALRRIMVAGPLTLYRITGPVAPALWSSPQALLANGPPLSLNAGALTDAFEKLFPVILSADAKQTARPSRQILFDDAVRSNSAADSIERIAGADSIDSGPNTGDAVIDRRPLEATGLHLRGTAKGPSTIAFDGTLAETLPKPIDRLNEIPRATILDRGAVDSVRHPSTWTRGLELSGFAIPIYEKPALRIVASRVASDVLFATVFELRDRSASHTYLLMGPPFRGGDPPVGELDIRDWLFRTIVENPRYDAALGRNDGFDRLQLVRIRLVQLSAPVHATQKFSLAVRAWNSIRGYPVRSVRLADALHYTCACTMSRAGSSERFVFTRFGRRRAGWMQGIVAIHARPTSYTAIISKTTRDTIAGTTVVAGQPFLVRRSQISSINPAPDAALIDLHFALPASGVLLLRGIVTPNVTLQLFVHTYLGHKNTWIAADIPYARAGRERAFFVRFDILATVRRAGYDRIGDAMILLKYVDPKKTQPAIVGLTDATAVSNRLGISRKANLSVSRGVVNTMLATGQVPLAVRFSSGANVQPSWHGQQSVPSARMRFSSQTGDRWLIFSHGFNPAWTLTDASGGPINATHFRVFGTLNAWYVPGGLRGSYQIIYTADSSARAGGAVALAGVCAAIALMLVPRSAGKRPAESEK